MLPVYLFGGISGCLSSLKSFGNTVIELAMVDSTTFAVEKTNVVFLTKPLGALYLQAQQCIKIEARYDGLSELSSVQENCTSSIIIANNTRTNTIMTNLAKNSTLILS